MQTLNQNELDADLAQLLAESVKPKKKPMADIGDLDDLLAESLQIRDEAAATKSMRETLKRNNLNRDERAEIEAKVREWESRNVWTPLATVAVFDRVICSCGCYTDAFSHLMHKQAHKEDKTMTRLIRSEEIIPKLPQLTALQTFEVELCGECAMTKGFDLTNAEEMQWDAPKI